MRAEDIVDMSFFALLLPSLVITISASRKTLSQGRRAFWRGCGLSLIGLAFLGLGLLTFQLIRSSSRPVVEGNIWDIREESNRGSHSTRFMVTDASGHAVMIRCKHTGPGFIEGERARVRYVEYNRKLVEMDMLTGPYGAWHLRESSGENGCWGWVAIGLACGIAGAVQLANARRTRLVPPVS